MGLTSYYTIDGEITGESTSGTRLDYLTDALGSVTAKVDQAGSVASSARYKPYGNLLSGSNYTFGWVGSYGYRKSVAGNYVRSRHYSSIIVEWSSLDRLWPNEGPFGYVSGNPITQIDPTGRAAITRSRVAGGIWEPNCNTYSVLWNFRVWPATTRGWLVQMVLSDYQVRTCSSWMEVKRGCDPIFTEVWLVYNGVPRDPISNGTGERWANHIPRFSDTWAWEGQPCTYGHDNTAAMLAFIPDSNADFEGRNDWLVENGFIGNHAWCSQALPSRIGTFALPSNSTPWLAPALLTNEFGCCMREKSLCNRPPSPECKNCDFPGPCFKDVASLHPKS